jgi:hypothetical protein
MSKNIFESLAEDVEVKVKNPGQKFVENSKIQLFLLIVTFYALFADDYRTLMTKPDMDINFDIFVWICIAIFTIEIVICCISKSGYNNSYYFYLDFISTGSLVLDFSPVRNALNEFGYATTSNIATQAMMVSRKSASSSDLSDSFVWSEFPKSTKV